MTRWQQVRTSLIVAAFIGVLFTLGRLIVDPDAVHHRVTPFAFPLYIPLPEGHLLESKPLSDKVTQFPRRYDAAISGRYYHYIQNGISLDIEMRYVVGTLGDVDSFFRNYTAIRLPPGQVFQALRQHQRVGFYGLFVNQGKAYLSTCINPHGESTVTTEQFLYNRHKYDLRFSRLVPWLLGEESLRDRRCLWVYLSTPLNKADPTLAYAVLEKAWFSWYQWWVSHFPKILGSPQNYSFSKEVALK